MISSFLAKHQIFIVSSRTIQTLLTKNELTNLITLNLNPFFHINNLVYSSARKCGTYRWRDDNNAIVTEVSDTLI